MLAHPKRSKTRRKLFKFLVNKGDHLNNFTTFETQKGKLIPCRQPPLKKSANDCLFCKDCQGLYVAKHLWRHRKVCMFKQSLQRDKGSRVQSLARNLMPIPQHVNKTFWENLCDMKHDDIASIVKKDPLILKFRLRLFKKCRKTIATAKKRALYDATKADYIWQKMREAARLLIAGKKFGLSCMVDFVLPENSKKVVKLWKVWQNMMRPL